MLSLGLLLGNGRGQEAVDTDDESSHYFRSLHHFIILTHSFRRCILGRKESLDGNMNCFPANN